MSTKLSIAIIGGGAAGFFSAIRAKSIYPNSKVVLIEGASKVLSKVKVSGGGRCNVTHACFQTSKLVAFYPRGGKLLKLLFQRFNTESTMAWFQSRGVPLKIESDNRVFPVSDNSQSILDVLMREIHELGIVLLLSSKLKRVKRCANNFELEFDSGELRYFDKLIIATGGHPKKEAYNWLKDLGHKIIDPVPSLFTFNMPTEPIRELMGVVAANTSVRIQGMKFQSSGPILITHWGMSGPAILKLSAFAARDLSLCRYQFKIQVNWINEPNEEIIRAFLLESKKAHPKALLRNRVKFDLPTRLWEFLLLKIEISPEIIWEDISLKSINRFVNVLVNDVYIVSGKTTFKEEFVTCGGVSIDSISNKTLQSKVCSGMYFAGEILDVDGVTGGFNFQAAWTTGYIAGELGED